MHLPMPFTLWYCHIDSRTIAPVPLNNPEGYEYYANHVDNYWDVL